MSDQIKAIAGQVMSSNGTKRKLIENYESGDESDEDQQRPKRSVPTEPDNRSRFCPYLDTIDRGVLDFDFEKLCSVSLSKINCYACLVCGKYFQGESGR